MLMFINMQMGRRSLPTSRPICGLSSPFSEQDQPGVLNGALPRHPWRPGIRAGVRIARLISTYQTKPVVVVTVVWIVPVAIGGPTVPGFVVPGAAPQHAASAHPSLTLSPDYWTGDPSLNFPSSHPTTYQSRQDVQKHIHIAERITALSPPKSEYIYGPFPGIHQLALAVYVDHDF